MPWTLKNVALEAAYAMKRRVAPKMDMEPVIAGQRIRLRQQIVINDELYACNKQRIDKNVGHGVLTATNSEQVGPTIEMWVKANYLPEKYPPEDYDEVPSVGLAHYKKTGYVTAEEMVAAQQTETEADETAVLLATAKKEEEDAETEAKEAVEEKAKEEASDVPEVESTGAGWYVLKLEGEEIDKVRGKEALREWFTTNGYAIPQLYVEPASTKDNQ